METTIEKVTIAYRILKNAKLTQMKDEDKFILIKIMRELKPFAISCEDSIKEASEKLRPQGLDEVERKIQSQEPLTFEEQRLLKKFNADIEKSVREELNKEVNLTFIPLNEEGFKDLLASNDFGMEEVMALYDIVVE